MKNIINNKIAGLFAAAAMLFATTSCVKDNVADQMQGDGVEVSFTLAPEGTAADTRADDDGHGHVHYPDNDKGENAKISDGTKADVLIYAVYKKNANGVYEVEPGDGVNNSGSKLIEVGNGQTAVSVNKFPYTLTIRLDKGDYRIAFWAQSGKCNAYDTKNLQQVEVIYSNITEDGASSAAESGSKISTPNNDEFRDAFCGFADVTVGDFGNVNGGHVDLYRPLAQVNVGTAGYDYEIITRGENSKKYTYSRIQLGYVARYLDVVNDKVLESTILDNPEDLRAEARSMVDFGYARIPAYINYLDKTDEYLVGLEKDGVKQYPSYVLDDEVFLEVDLNHDGNIVDYVSLKDYDENAGTDPDKKPTNYTETFKYLSMCYVLVDSQANPDYKPNGDEDPYIATTLDNVTVYLATDENGTDEIEIVNLNNVPVQRNWRTNIISQNLLTADAQLTVDLSPMYNGDYNYVDGEWQTIIYDGVSYDPQKDEIVISNANGLIWLSKMVNGKYDRTVYNNSGIEEHFKSEGIVDPTIGDDSEAAKLLKRTILHATHQDTNQNYKDDDDYWPANNNFHFMGKNEKGEPYPAKVRLAEDIDLSRVEWIPIGFAANIGDTYDFFSDKYAEHVGFCGEFDGGGHTIRNITNKKFSANVHETSGQKRDYVPISIKDRTDLQYPLWNKNGGYGPYDCPQWSPVGLFGQIAENASVHDVRLYNVDFFGYHCAGAIAGIATGDNIVIENCYVDSGTVTLSPMYRGDYPRELYNNDTRTFARGIYLGGIVGQYNARGSVVNCDVRNVVIHGYRNIGGLIGSIKNTSDWEVKAAKNGTDDINTLSELTDANNPRKPKNISNNALHNVIVIADKFQPYDYFWHTSDNEAKVYKNGFGWNDGQSVFADIFIGGNGSDSKFYGPDDYTTAGVADNVTFTAFATNATTASTARTSTISTVPLEYMPMLSSWFVDEIAFTGNFSGSHSAYKKLNMHKFAIFSSNKDDKYQLPMNLPYDLSPDFDKNSGNVGMYVESVTIDGGTKNEISGRTIVTIDDVQNEGDCVMYITSRDRKEFETEDPKLTKHSTVVESMTLRGDPYAYAGICLAPNKYTSSITLKNIAIYDVYKTLELDSKLPSGDNAATTLIVTADDGKTSNLRGYTDCGAGWQEVQFERTVFERGANTGNGADEYTCNIQSPTTFTKCYFKAPYIIKIADGGKVTFDTKGDDVNNKTIATSASSKKTELKAVDKCAEIVISDNGKGDVVVTYKDAQGTVLPADE